jgi:hypothetical protein
VGRVARHFGRLKRRPGFGEVCQISSYHKAEGSKHTSQVFSAPAQHKHFFFDPSKTAVFLSDDNLMSMSLMHATPREETPLISVGPSDTGESPPKLTANPLGQEDAEV